MVVDGQEAKTLRGLGLGETEEAFRPASRPHTSRNREHARVQGSPQHFSPRPSHKRVAPGRRVKSLRAAMSSLVSGVYERVVYLRNLAADKYKNLPVGGKVAVWVYFALHVVIGVAVWWITPTRLLEREPLRSHRESMLT